MKNDTRHLLALLAVLASPALAFEQADLGDAYALQVSPPARAKAKQRATATVRITFEPEAHLNKEFPTRLTLHAPRDVALAKALLEKDDVTFDGTAAVLQLAFTPSSPGKKEITGELRFAVCLPDECYPQTKPITLTVDVK